MRMSLNQTDHEAAKHVLARLVELAMHEAVASEPGEKNWQILRDGITALEAMSRALPFPDDDTETDNDQPHRDGNE